jgi:hypothetical protein
MQNAPTTPPAPTPPAATLPLVPLGRVTAGIDWAIERIQSGGFRVCRRLPSSAHADP